jgi:crotonobetaine/carnitine-CoA ligase
MRARSTVTFAQRWDEAVAGRRDHDFLLWLGSDDQSTRWTYGEFDALVTSVAHGLQARGVGPGSPVHLALKSCPAFVALWLAVTRLGAWMVPSDPQASATELTGHIARTRAVVGVCARDRADVYRAAVAAVDSAQRPTVIEVDETDVDLDVLRSPGSSIEVASPEPLDRLAVMFTSGTTSAPKGVVLTQAGYAFAGDVMAAACALGPDDRQLVVLPLFHANAQYYSFASAISVGASVALVATFSASGFRSQAARLAATHASLFAAPMRMILARDPGDDIEGLALRHVWFAQNLTSEQYERFAELVGCRPRQLYGMTETLPAVVTHRFLGARCDVMGQTTLGCAVEVVDPDTLTPAPDGVVGDLLVGGYPGTTLFSGYLDDEATTEAAIAYRREDGFVWFRTGDRATRDPDGSFRFAGRGGDVLKVAGENVSVVEVEAVVAEHPDVFEVAVVGEPDPVRDEVPVAYVVASPGATLDTEAIKAWAAERLAPSKRPRAVYQVEELPRTSVGKIRKFMLTSPPSRDDAT